MRFKDDLQRFIYYKSQIDYCYYAIQEICEQKGELKSPLEMMIDDATGYSKEKLLQRIDEAIYLIKVVIRCKPKCGFEVDSDKKFLSELKKFKNQTKK